MAKFKTKTSNKNYNWLQFDLRLLTEDLPSSLQYDSTVDADIEYTKHVPWTNVQYLQSAVLLRAIADYLGNPMVEKNYKWSKTIAQTIHEHRREAKAWLMSDIDEMDDEYPFAFRNICQSLNLCPKEVRSRLKALAKQGARIDLRKHESPVHFPKPKESN